MFCFRNQLINCILVQPQWICVRGCEDICQTTKDILQKLKTGLWYFKNIFYFCKQTKKMKFFFLFFLSLIFSICQCFSSSLINKNPEFAYISENTNNTSLRFIQTIEYSGTSQDNFGDIFFSLKKTATSMGANCFKMNSYCKNDEGKISLRIDTYYGDSLYLLINKMNYEQNIIYIISDLELHNQDYYFLHNGESKSIRSGRYYKIHLAPNSTTKIRLNGLFGKLYNFQWMEHQKVRFFILSKSIRILFSLRIQYIPIGPARRKNLIELDQGFGYFLLNCLKEQEK